MPSYIELDKQLSFPSSSNPGKIIFGVNSSGETVTVNSNGVVTTYAPKYKVFTALLTQSGGDSPSQANYDNLVPLIIGQTYLINDNAGGADFINVGAPNNNIGTYFVATGITPDNWGQGSLNYNEGAPVATVLENTIGNVWFTYNYVGFYQCHTDESFPYNKTLILSTPVNTNDSNIIFVDNQVSSIQISNSTLNGTWVNNVLSNTSIEIRVYN
jgi:hypothetical protein